ncbi:MAG: aldo/keto reductase [Alphaproteobacteria bacterium]|nr:aldo/keto reductase [Alphaproteobacteria bacterium]
MRTKSIPKSEEPLPVVGLGTSRVFNIGTSEAERAPRREVLEVLFASGGRVIDTSPMYGNSERVVGELLVELDDVELPFIATKVWTRGGADGIAQMNESFDLLHKRPLDLIQVHNLVDMHTHLKTLRRWKDEGLIRYLGITHYTSSALDELTRIVETEPLDFVQCAYSISVRAAEERLLPACRAHGVATLINRPYERGAVFGRVKGRPLPAWAADFDCASWGQFFLKFILGHPGATCVIPGTSKAKHMRDNTGAGFGRLPDEAERARMIALWEEL